MNRRKLIRDGGYLFGAEILARLFAFSVSFVLARQVGLEALAFLSLAQSIVAFATVAGDAGLGTSAVRRIALGQESQTVVRDTARAQILLSLIASAVVIPAVAVQVNWLMALSVGSLPLITAATTTYVLQGRLDAKGIAISRVVANVVVGFCGISLSLLQMPLWVIALAYPLGALAAMLVVNNRAGSSARMIIGPINLDHLRAEAAPYISLAVFTIVVHAYSACLIVLSQNIANGEHFTDVGISTRLLLLMVIPAQILGSLLLPRYSAVLKIKDLNRQVRLHSGIAFLIGIAIFGSVYLNAGWAVPLAFGPSAEHTVDSVVVISAQVPFAMLSTVWTARLLSLKLYGRATVAYLVALLAQIALCFLLSESTSPVFVSAIVISEALFALLMVAASIDPRGRFRSSARSSL